MKRKLFCLLFAAFICVLLSSCRDADIIIRTDLEGVRITGTTVQTEKVIETDAEGKYALIINKSSGVFHVSADCYHASVMKEENRLIKNYENISDAVLDGYRPCGSCAKKYITEDENG